MATNAELQAENDELRRQLEASGGGDGKKKNSGGRFVVLTSAIVVKVGPATNNTRRYVRGQVFTPPDIMDQETVDRFLHLGAIAPDDGEPKKAATVRDIARKSGAGDDPAASPIVDFLPADLPTKGDTEEQQKAADADAASEGE